MFGRETMSLAERKDRVSLAPNSYGRNDGSAFILVQRFGANARLHSTRAPAIRSVRDIITDWKERGLPIAAIAECAQVQRKTVYGWLDGNAVARAENETRVQQLDIIFGSVNDLRALYRLWNTPMQNGTPLREILSGNMPVATNTVNDIRGTIDRLSAQDARRLANGDRRYNARLDEIPVAGLRSSAEIAGE
jgi:hypothetical protein